MTGRAARRRLSRLAAVALAGIALTAARTPDAGAALAVEGTSARPAAAAIEASILDRINAVRRDHGLRPLHVAAGLRRAAASYVARLASAGLFTHGSSPSARIHRFYGGSRVAEVIVWRSPGLTAEQAVAAWLGSPSHRSIILGAAYAEIGLGAKAVASAPGYYGGRRVTIVVADLGAR